MKTKKVYSAVLTFLFFIAFGCSSVPQEPRLTEIPTSNPLPGIEAIAILGTNDIHGALAPFSLKTREASNSLSTSYPAGGVATLAAYIDILRSEWGDHLIWLDAGDQFQGSIDSNSQQGAPMVQFFNATHLTASAVGNHEFDFGLPALKARMSEAHYPYLAANIRDKPQANWRRFPILTLTFFFL